MGGVGPHLDVGEPLGGLCGGTSCLYGDLEWVSRVHASGFPIVSVLGGGERPCCSGAAVDRDLSRMLHTFENNQRFPSNQDDSRPSQFDHQSSMMHLSFFTQ